MTLFAGCSGNKSITNLLCLHGIVKAIISPPCFDQYKLLCYFHNFIGSKQLVSVNGVIVGRSAVV